MERITTGKNNTIGHWMVRKREQNAWDIKKIIVLTEPNKIKGAKCVEYLEKKCCACGAQHNQGSKMQGIFEKSLCLRHLTKLAVV